MASCKVMYWCLIDVHLHLVVAMWPLGSHGDLAVSDSNSSVHPYVLSVWYLFLFVVGLCFHFPPEHFVISSK